MLDCVNFIAEQLSDFRIKDSVCQAKIYILEVIFVSFDAANIKLIKVM